MNTITKLSAALILVFGVSGIAKATALFNVTDNGNYFSDITSGLDWLDVTETIDQRKIDVTYWLQAGEIYEGWEYATAAQLAAMVDSVTHSDSGVDGVGQSNEFVNRYTNEYRDLVEMLGVTSPNPIWKVGTKGLLSENRSISLGSFGSVSFSAVGEIYNNRGSFLSNDWDFDGLSTDEELGLLTSDINIGSFLIRQTVIANPNTPVTSPPINSPTATVSSPATLLLFALGFIGLGMSRKKRPLGKFEFS